MHRGQSLEEVRTEVARQYLTAKDYVAVEQSLHMEEHSGGFAFEVGDAARVGLLDTAHTQIAGRLKIPKTYYDKMRQEAPGLLADNVNTWLRRSDKKRLVRTLDGDARAYLSDGYRPLDNHELLRAVLPQIEEAGLEMRSCAVTDTRLYLQAVSRTLRGEVKRGDIVEGGIVISNSEIGMGRLRVETVLHRLVCLNGMIVADGLKKTHVGRRSEIEDGAAEYYRDETREADDAAFWLKVRDTVSALLMPENFARVLDRLRESTERKIEGDPAKAVEVVQRKLRLTDEERTLVLRNLIEGHDLSAWGVANAITACAHKVADYDRCVDFERMGSKVIELPRRDWTEIAKAA